ncbi:type II toxin-antitoxin system PemK/MazF family toxin [bacterium]|nr:type II toxin-antitoxin system PemK/MazF family toxin [bacterium]
MNRGEIWWAGLPAPQGSEPGFRRPVVVLQSDDFNRSRIRTVIVLVITSNLDLKDAPGNVFLPASESGLPKDSVVNISQVLTLNKSRLTRRAGSVPSAVMRRVEAGVCMVLNLSPRPQ